MAKPLEINALGGLVEHRLIVLGKLNDELKRIDINSEELAASLEAVVPQKLRLLMASQGIIHSLVKFGLWSGNINFEVCGFSGAAALKAALRQLGRVWEGNVTIVTDPPEVGRMRVRFHYTQH